MFTDDDLIAARDAGILNENDCKALIAYLRGRKKGLPQSEMAAVAPPAPVRFDLTHVLWYAGALIVITAMGLFTNEAFNRMGGKALTATAIVYAGVFIALGDYLWRKKGLRTPGGLAVAIAVAMTPMAVYGVQDQLGLWSEALGSPGEYRGFFPYINASWLYMELATIVAAILALRFYPFPFITMIAAVALWFMSMDLAAWFARADVGDFELRRQVSLWFGLAVMASGWIVDLKWRTRGNFAFWLHLAGAAAFWGGLSFSKGASEWQGALYCLINIGLVIFAVFIGRRIYAIFGALGIAIYLGHLADDIFKDALLFSFALSAIGLLTIGLGIAFHQNHAAIGRGIDARLPRALRALRPAGREG
ncbi:hypothetical protein [Methylocapsa aurea]|uniref:hypothetical protein n=1 Tax=Methylocapsa aurea TaxID=663610 RepID=UPI00056A09D5|nr:hypothetical protein [Methylocapsa aurea]